MYRVEVMNPCSCFIKNGFSEIQEFTSKEEAKEEANNLVQKMSTNFCQKHEFSMLEKFGDFIISVKPRR